MQDPVATQRLGTQLLFELVHGDLTEESVEAIVNAANEHLQHGGGVAAAIARKGGRQIREESRRWVTEHGPINHDSPALTGAGALPCNYVIHAVGPRWGEGDEHDKLRRAVTSALALAADRGFASLALPPISTGIFGFPKDEAAAVILDSIEAFAQDYPGSSLQRIRLTILDQATLTPFLRAFQDRWPAAAPAA